MLTTENNHILDFAVPVTKDTMTFSVSIIIRENCFSFSHEQTKCNLGNLVVFFLKYLLHFQLLVFSQAQAPLQTQLVKVHFLMLFSLSLLLMRAHYANKNGKKKKKNFWNRMQLIREYEGRPDQRAQCPGLSCSQREFDQEVLAFLCPKNNKRS